MVWKWLVVSVQRHLNVFSPPDLITSDQSPVLDHNEPNAQRFSHSLNVRHYYATFGQRSKNIFNIQIFLASVCDGEAVSLHQGSEVVR